MGVTIKNKNLIKKNGTKIYSFVLPKSILNNLKDEIDFIIKHHVFSVSFISMKTFFMNTEHIKTMNLANMFLTDYKD